MSRSLIGNSLYLAAWLHYRGFFVPRRPCAWVSHKYYLPQGRRFATLSLMTRTEAVNHTSGSAARAVVVFTDLDGTLMDHVSYAVAPAKPALDALAARSIPVVPVTSKTRAELVPLMARLGLSGAAIAENGAVIMHSDGSVDAADTCTKIT